MKDDIIIRSLARILIPMIQLFALYVIAHGEEGPGGGFQGGVILGASFILHVLVFGAAEGRKRISERASDLLSSTGVLLYAMVGVASLIFGGMYLQYNVLPFGSPELANGMGIFAIELGVGITVAGVMVTIFFEMAASDDD